MSNASVLEEYARLAGVLETIRAAGVVETKVNVGSHCYMNAIATDPQSVMLRVMDGVHVLLTLEEALEFIDKRIHL